MAIKEPADSSGAPTSAEAALELMKQLITLAAGVLALSATFIGDFPVRDRWLLALLGVAWLLLATAVLFGLETISAIVGSRLDPEQHWSKGYGKTAARVSKYSFVSGLTTFALFAFLMLLLDATGSEVAIDCVSHR